MQTYERNTFEKINGIDCYSGYDKVFTITLNFVSVDSKYFLELHDEPCITRKYSKRLPLKGKIFHKLMSFKAIYFGISNKEIKC